MDIYLIGTKSNGGDYHSYFVESDHNPTSEEVFTWLMENSNSSAYWENIDDYLEIPHTIMKVEPHGKI